MSEPMSYRYRSVEALRLLPTSVPDRSRHTRCGPSDALAATLWLMFRRPDEWGDVDPFELYLVAGRMVGRRVDVERGELV